MIQSQNLSQTITRGAPRSVACLVLMAVGSSVSMAAAAGADEQSAPPAAVGAAPAVEAGVGTTETAAGKTRIAAVPPLVKMPSLGVATAGLNVNGSRLLVVSRILAGVLTTDQAWQSGALGAEDALRVLAEPQLAAGEANEKLRRELAGLLVQHAPERVKDIDTLPSLVRLALGNYYASVKDARAVEMCRSVLRELDEERTRTPERNEREKTGGAMGAAASSAPSSSTRAAFPSTPAASPWPRLWALVYLAHYYRDTNQLRESAEAWLRGREYWNDSMWRGGALMEAARLYKQMGGAENERKAQELYAQVPQQGAGWMTGLARWDEANTLIESGKHEEARRLLKQPLEGARSDQARVGLLSLLAYSYYRTGEFEQARRYAEETAPQAKALAAPLAGANIEGQAQAAQEAIRWAEQWEKYPILCEPGIVSVQVTGQERDAGHPLTRRLAVRVPRSMAVSATIEHPQVRIRPINDEPAKDHEYFFEKEWLVEIAPEALQSNWEATIVISSPGVPNFELEVPLQVQAPQ